MKRLESLARNLSIPLVGIVAFALASVWSLFQLFYTSALHPTLLYWLPAVLVEFVTAWLVYQAIESLRVALDTKATKRDRRFHLVLFALCAVLSAPTLAVSFSANRFEFQNHVGLALLFPVSCVACAVATAIPHVKARQVDERLKATRDELRTEREMHKETRDKLQEAQKPRVLVEPSPADFERVREGLNGNHSAWQFNIALTRAGFLPMSEGTIRSRLQ